MQACQAQTQCRAGAGFDCTAPDCRPSSAGVAAMSTRPHSVLLLPGPQLACGQVMIRGVRSGGLGPPVASTPVPVAGAGGTARSSLNPASLFTTV